VIIPEVSKRMECVLNEEGVLFIRGIPTKTQDIPYLVRSKRSDWSWSSWHWIEDLKRDIPGFSVFDIKGLQYLDDLQNRRDRIVAAIVKGSTVHTDILDRVFATELWPAQKHAAAVMAAARRFYLADDVGLGKSLSAFAALVLLRELGRINNACIVCTASVKFQWKLEIEKALRPEYRDKYSITVIHGDKQERIKAYGKDSFLYIVNYESLRHDEYRGFSPFRQAGKRMEAVIFDEAWKIKSYTAKIQKLMREFFRNTEYRFALNASPVGNGYEELFGIFDVIDPSVFLSWRTFKERYLVMKTIRSKDQKKSFPKVMGYRRVPEIKHRVRAYILRRTVKDMGWKSPQVTVTPYWIALDENMRKAYTKISKNLGTNALEKTIRARVACLFTDETPPESSPKYRELLNVLENQVAHEKVIVFSESLTFLKAVLPHLIKKKISTLLVSGKDSSDLREVKKQQFTDGNARVLLATSAGEAGLNLQAASIVINLDLPWNPERLRQRVGRLRPHLGGENRHIRVINILAEDTIEERIVRQIQKKIGYFEMLFKEETLDLTGVFTTPNLLSAI